MTSRKTKSVPYTVGYGKPPKHTRFRKGQSGNPGGRPPRPAAERAKALALREAYRRVSVKEGRGVVAVPAIQAIMRSQIVLATKGNVQAQRAVLAAIQTIEQENAEVAARTAQAAPKGPFNYIEAARRVAFLLHLGDEEEKKLKSEQEKKKARATQSGTDEGFGAAPHAPRFEAGSR